MSGKRKRGEDFSAQTAANGKPLTAIAAARLRTEAATKVEKISEVTSEQISVPASPLMGETDPEHEDSD